MNAFAFLAAFCPPPLPLLFFGGFCFCVFCSFFSLLLCPSPCASMPNSADACSSPRSLLCVPRSVHVFSVALCFSCAFPACGVRRTDARNGSESKRKSKAKQSKAKQSKTAKRHAKGRKGTAGEGGRTHGERKGHRPQGQAKCQCAPGGAQSYLDHCACPCERRNSYSPRHEGVPPCVACGHCVPCA
jgi:hypothetical protein